MVKRNNPSAALARTDGSAKGDGTSIAVKMLAAMDDVVRRPGRPKPAGIGAPSHVPVYPVAEFTLR
jgi:hypothetical protein